MLSFFFQVLKYLVPLFLVVFLVNYYVDPGEIYSDNSEEISKYINSGHNVKLPTVPTEWGKLQVKVVTQWNEENRSPKKLVIWGNSRSAEINKKMVGTNDFYNCAVPGGTILDLMALHQLFDVNGQMPQNLIISIDPFSFYSRKGKEWDHKTYNVSDTSASLVVKTGFEKLLHDALIKFKLVDSYQYYPSNSLKTKIIKFIEFSSPSYFQSSLKYFYSGGVFPLSDNAKSNITDFIIKNDGSYVLQAESQINPDQVIGRVSKFTQAQNGLFFYDNVLTTKYINMLRLLLLDLKKRNIKTSLFLSPIHPILYDQMILKEKNLLEVELIKFCKENDISIIGSYNPHLYGLTSSDSDFIDEYHLSSSAIQKVLINFDGTN